MSNEDLYRVIEQLPPEKLERLKNWAISLLHEDEPTPGPRRSFDDAMNRTFEVFDDTLRRLAE